MSESLGADDELLERVDEEGIVFTAGVSSAVLDGDECVGHVLLLDCDDVDRITATKAAESMSGVTALFESSAGSFHLWNLSVREWEDAVLSALSWRVSDSEHVAQSYRRGRFVLRTTAKVREDSTFYKAAPQLLSVSVDLEDEDLPQSLPHLLRLESIAEEQDAAVSVPSPEDVPTVGERNGLGVDRYMTLTDEAKGRLRGSE